MKAPQPARVTRHAMELDALTAVAQAIVSAASLPELLDGVLAELSRVLPPAEQGLVLLRDAGTDQLRAAATLGTELPENRRLALPTDCQLLIPILEQKQALLLTSRLQIEQAVAGIEPEVRATLLLASNSGGLPRGLLAVPLLVGAEAIGSLWLVNHARPARFTAKDIPFVQRLAGLLAAAIDRTVRGAPAERARTSQAADQLRSEVTATLSHELRTPLAAIKGYATALLLDEVDWSDADRREFLELIERECDNLQAMVGEMLDSALIDTGHLGVEPEPVRLALLAHEAADEAQRQTTRHQLVMDFPTDFPLLEADPRRVRQVLRNILDNAIKYSPDGGLIVIRGEARPADVVVSVADQGVGIAPEDLVPLFDKYFRVKPSGGTQVPGTGLGLPITRGIVEAHGGRIWAESRLGHGTTLYFSLPLPEAGASPAE